MDICDLDAIYDFWFGDDRSPTDINPERIRWWMLQNDDTDRQVRDGFGHLLGSASRQNWEHSSLSREQSVALVVLFDQFSRNIFRATGEAFAFDHLAREVVKHLTSTGWDRFTAMERFILGLPYVHHEDEASQDLAVLLISEACVKAPPATREHHRFDLDHPCQRTADTVRRPVHP